MSYIPTAANTIPKIIEACQARLAMALTMEMPPNTNTAGTETVLKKSSTHFENKEIGLAVNTLCAHLETIATKYTPVVDVAVLFLIDITIFSGRIAKLQKVFLTYQKITAHEKISRIDYITNHVVNRLDDLMAQNDLTSDQISADATFLAAVIPETTANVIKVGQATVRDSVVAFMQLYFKKYRFTFGNTFQTAYLSTLTKMLDFANRHKLGNLLMGLSNSLRDFAKDLFSRNDVSSTSSLESAIKNASGVIINLRFSILEAAIKLAQWQVVKYSLEEVVALYRQIEDAVKRVNRTNPSVVARHTNDIEIANRRFAVTADVFLKCENWVFHADSLRGQFAFAAADAKAAIATKAIVAALASPAETDDSDSKVAMGFFEEQTPAMRLASMLALNRIPTRTSVVADVADLLESADANVQVLYKMVTERKSVDIASIYKHLEALKGSSAFAGSSTEDSDRYIRAIERALLEFFMDTHFNEKAVLDFTSLDKIKVMFPKQNDITMIAAGLSARVDMKARQASFNTAELKIRNCISSIGTKTSKMLAMPIVRRKVAITATNLEAENTRLNNRVQLSTACVNKADERAKNLKRKETEEASNRRAEIEAEERERHDKLRAANYDKMKKKVEHAENVERRKKVVEITIKRNPGIIVPPKVVEDGKSFLDRASAILAQYRRDAEEKRTISLREAHYLEKYIRDTEKPKREELEANMSEQYKKDSEARIENFKAQHRRNFEAQVALKATMDRYRSRAEEYQANSIAAAGAATKVSKRDEQEDLLRQEKERLMAEMMRD